MKPVARFLPFALVFALGCSPRLGDGCSIPTNCSINGDRLCDTSQPGGYCTILDCGNRTCPEDGVCVRFNENTRTVIACMRPCGGDGDCRGEYRCAGRDDLTLAVDGGDVPDGGVGASPALPALAVEILDEDRPGARFCVARVP